MVVVADGEPLCCLILGGTLAGGFGFQERLGWFLQLGLHVIPYGALGCGLYWPTALACSVIYPSLKEP